MGSEDKLDLSQLKNPELQQNITNLGQQIQRVDDLLSLLNSQDGESVYNKMDAADRAQIDLFKTYAVNSLFWVYLKTRGKDAANHAVKNELGRVKEHLNRAKQLKDRTKAPRLNPGAAKRFVRSGLWEPKDKSEQPAKEQHNNPFRRPGKRKHDNKN